ncbi:MAG: hypothetical protein B7X57_09390 [Erythrobacter sp. 34-65-8]|nr:MAG: hypothetical protein B7X57_09390 [Erythrobacter sp. 34-65-8]
MFRRLLACLALLTGLAAIGTPANAAFAETLSAQVGVSKAASGTPAAERRECSAQRGTNPAKRDVAPQCKHRRAIVITIPTVQYGPDRALE